MADITDVEMLADAERESRLAAAGYLTMATQVRDPAVKDMFLEFSRHSITLNAKFAELINQLGGRP
ncbi:MAG: hypothetical protein H5U02_09815 [Clostridia bacterium]|nr:hypothetical protein [Clostridia bacterium]